MDSVAVWSADDSGRGLRWRDAVTVRMRQADGYLSYEGLLAAAADELALPREAVDALLARWSTMAPNPDAAAIAGLELPYAFVTNCSTELADRAAARSGLAPRFVLSAEEAGAYKPAPSVYREACRRLGTAVARTLFVAGSPYDAEGADRAGLRAVLVNRRPELPPPRRRIPVVGSLTEVVEVLNRDPFGGL